MPNGLAMNSFEQIKTKIMITREEYNKALDIVEAYHKQLFIDSVSGCFPDDKEIELHSNVHSDDYDFRPNTYSSYKEGMEDCIELIKEKLNNR